ncbi:alpha-2-macroglobulin-like [Salvelinus alpinus]
MVAIPVVIQAGSEAKLCASLLQPNETLVMTISLIVDEQSKILLQESSDQEFHRCFQFQAPHVESDKVLNFKVEVRGETFLSTEERKVMIKPYSPMTFIQTDKPIYNPGQTVQFRVIALDTSFSPVNQLFPSSLVVTAHSSTGCGPMRRSMRGADEKRSSQHRMDLAHNLVARHKLRGEKVNHTGRLASLLGEQEAG